MLQRAEPCVQSVSGECNSFYPYCKQPLIGELKLVSGISKRRSCQQHMNKRKLYFFNRRASLLSFGDKGLVKRKFRKRHSHNNFANEVQFRNVCHCHANFALTSTDITVPNCEPEPPEIVKGSFNIISSTFTVHQEELSSVKAINSAKPDSNATGSPGSSQNRVSEHREKKRRKVKRKTRSFDIVFETGRASGCNAEKTCPSINAKHERDTNGTLLLTHHSIQRELTSLTSS